MEHMSIADILSDKPPVAPVEPPEAPAEAAAPEPQSNTSTRKQHQQIERDAREAGEGRVRDPETGQYVAKKEEPVAPVEPAAPAPVAPPPAQEMTAKEKAAFAKAADETRKRQEIEREVAELRAKLQQHAAPAAPAEPAKTFFEAPDEALEAQKREFMQMVLDNRLDTFEEIARTKYPDFEEKLIEFGELTKINPMLTTQMIKSRNPAEFAYQTAKSHKELQDAGNIEAIKEKIEKETRVKVEAEVRAKIKAEEDARKAAIADLPPSLTNVHGTNPATRPVWGGPPSIESILGGK